MESNRTKSAEQSKAEASVDQVKRQLGPFVVAAETTRMAMVFTDAKLASNPIIFANDAYLSLTGFSREEVLGRDFSFLVLTDSGGAARLAAQFFSGSETPTEVFYRRKSMPPIWVAVFIAPVHDTDDKVVQHFASFVDLSSHKEEQALSKTLIDELNHRVKNTLTTVKSIVTQGLRSSHSLDSIRESIDSRLFALSRSHDLLARENWRSASFFDVVQDAIKPFERGPPAPQAFFIHGDDLRVSPAVALALGIALHELATNAVKYGSLMTLSGSVALSWKLQPLTTDHRLLLCWQEKGGPPVVKPTRRGFGTKVIERGLTHELEATVQLEYAQSGLVCRLEIPLITTNSGVFALFDSAT